MAASTFVNNADPATTPAPVALCAMTTDVIFPASGRTAVADHRFLAQARRQGDGGYFHAAPAKDAPQFFQRPGHALFGSVFAQAQGQPDVSNTIPM